MALDNSGLKKKFLKYFSELPVQKLAAASIGISEDTCIDWKRADPHFANQIDNAKAAWALKKTKKIKSEEWLLERVMKDHFAQRSELTGKEGQPLPTPIYNGKSTDK